jgi:hypothetical protein
MKKFYESMCRRESMKPIREAAGQDLQWKRVRWGRREFALRSGEEVLAMLYWQKDTRSNIGAAADGSWAFKRRSLWNAEIVITDVASQSEIAVFKRGRKKSLVFSDGRALTFQKASFWRNEWVRLNDEGTALIHFQGGKHLRFEPSALTLPELSLLVILGWHLIVLQQEEAAAASAAVAASV